MNILIFGPNGSGKGTQGEKKKRYDCQSDKENMGTD